MLAKLDRTTDEIRNGFGGSIDVVCSEASLTQRPQESRGQLTQGIDKWYYIHYILSYCTVVS